MRTIQIVFPVLRGTRKFFIQKGRRWSLIEHLLLDAVCRGTYSASDLATQSGLPRRVIVEAFIRLMRAGWVEIILTTGGPAFRATALGMVQAPLEELPAATIIQPKYRSFAIEQVTGGVFRSRELDIRPQSRLPATTDDQIVAHLAGSPLHAAGDLSEVFTAIEGDDELIVGIDKSAEKLMERYALVSVREDIIEGLPARASQQLRNSILAKAKGIAATFDKQTKSIPEAVKPSVPEAEQYPQSANEPWVTHNALYDIDDLIIDGPAHDAALKNAIRNASERLIVHSTFITEARAKDILPSLLQAAARGVAVDILWGQDENKGVTSTSRLAAAKLQAAIADAGRSDSIVIHPFSTQSHAKIVVTDNGKGRWYALVGSCNWLASDFTSFETSIRLRDPVLVGELTRKLAGLARGRPGLWHDFSVELTLLGRRIEDMPRGSGRTTPIKLLFAPDHARVALEARDRSKSRIFVLSHRMGIAARPVALLPTLAAVKANNVEATAYYGQVTGRLTGADSADIAREFRKEGVEIYPVHRPRLHAKVLGWDDDVLAISSLNWLSADPSDHAPYREIGVLIEAPKIADNFISRFEHSRAG